MSDSQPHSLSEAVRRGALLNAKCPSRDVLRHLTGRWAVLVLIVLQDGTHRFSELRRKIGGVSERMLAETLQGLEADGMLIRTDHRTVPPHVDYDLTELGREAAEKVAALADWIEVSMPRIMARQAETASSRLAAQAKALENLKGLGWDGDLDSQRGGRDEVK